MLKLPSIKTHATILIVSLLLLMGCKASISEPTSASVSKKELPSAIREYSIAAVLWQQRSAEYRALAYQAFNLAKLQVEAYLQNASQSEKPLAIITDIDETILDNSPYSGKQIQLDEDYIDERWDEWVDLEAAKVVPGALGFFQYAASKGIEIFYVSNRDTHHMDATLGNLKKVGFPYANTQHVLLRENDSEKETRREKISETHEVIMLVGDNLSDFSHVFEKRTSKARNKSADSLKSYFGKKFIVLPNPIYGDWETQGIYIGRYDWNEFQKDSLRRSKVIGY